MEFDECVNCGAGLISVSDICPQCGWPKNKPLSNTEDKESVEREIEEQQDLTEETIVKKTIFRPAGIRLLGIFQIVLGVLLICFAIFFASMIIFAMINSAIGSVGNMAMFSEISGLDQDALSSFNSMSGAGNFNMDEMMLIMGSTFANASIVIILGLFAIIVGKGLLKGKNWARWLIIVSAIISIPISVSLFGNLDIWTILGSAVFDVLVVFYMTKPKIREYFNQDSIKKSEIKTDKVISKVKQTIETASVPDRPSGNEGLDSSNKRVRPIGVMILVILQVVSGIHLIVGAADIIEITASTNDLIDSIGGGSSGFSMFTMSTIFFQIISTIFIIFGIASFIMALGLFKAKSWAWTLTCFFAIITLVLGVISMNIVIIILDVILLYYLYRSNVKDYFGKSAQQF